MLLELDSDQRLWQKTVQEFLKWQNTLDPRCTKKIERRLLELFRAKATSASSAASTCRSTGLRRG